jgi:hypothetical protein
MVHRGGREDFGGTGWDEVLRQSKKGASARELVKLG